MNEETKIDAELFDDELDARARKRSRRWKWLSAVGAVVLVAAGALVAMNMGAANADGAEKKDADATAEAEEEGEEKAPVPVEVVALNLGDVSSYISATANLVAEEDVTVVSETEGRVTTLNVEEGDRVSKGQVLAVLDRGDEEIAVRKAEARLENARLAYDRAADLFSKELVSQEDHDKLKADFEVAEQELAEARWELERNTFRAPFSGRVTSRKVQVGQHVRPGDELFQVTDFDPLIARIHLPETDVLGLSEGREVRIALNADPDVRFSGRIRQISPVVDTATGTVKLTIEASDPPAGVRPGSFVSVNVVRQTHQGSVLLPRQAVIRELQSSHVFIAHDGVAEKRKVTLGIEDGAWIEAVDGVAAGDQVVVAGQGGLKDGASIRVLEPAADEAAAG
ncbi:MAG: efflux RND transporter periplasmic adaptor subunit [Thermoanaerobaculia bacterium]